MMISAKVVLGAGAALLGFVALAKASPGSGLGSSNAPNPPPKSEPEGELGVPVFVSSTAASGRVYDTWMYPPKGGLTYTIVRAKGTDQWLSFAFHVDTAKRIPVKTNVSNQTVLGLMKTDWLIG